MGVNPMQPRRCIALLGGSFDPIHNGHIALATYFAERLKPDELRIIPAGNPWQKDKLKGSAKDRIAMIQCAFEALKIPVTIDQQEIQRHTATYSIDTLRAIRAETGPETSVVFIMGADQLQQLDTWKDWQHLFDYAHICAASRPGFSIDAQHMPQRVANEFAQRMGTLKQIRTVPYGLTYLGSDLAVDVSSTGIRTTLQHGSLPEQLLPRAVLDYIKHHHLYKN
jgi:nicotinate-nucleotide adenylyltransferase